MAKSIKTLDELIQDYLTDSNTSQELEIKFGTKGIHSITKIKYQNVIKRMLSLGFKPLMDKETYLLRISNNFITQDGSMIQSNIRTEMEGLGDIQQYCMLNELVSRETGNLDFNVDFVQKKYKKSQDGTVRYSVDNNDFNFRATLATETTFTSSSEIVKELLRTWNESKKVFRLSLIHI